MRRLNRAILGNNFFYEFLSGENIEYPTSKMEIIFPRNERTFYSHGNTIFSEMLCELMPNTGFNMRI